MKNVIMIVLDSFSYFEYEFAKKRGIIPFLSSLEDNSIFASNLYSEGPHSEVGVRGLIGGCHTLDYGGSSRYFMEVDETVFDIFLDDNYDVSYIANPLIYLPERIRRNENFCQYYTVVYKFLYLWRNRMDYWAELYSKRDLNEREKKIAIDLCKDAFSVMLDFWRDVVINPESIKLIKRNVSEVNAEDIVEIILNENNRFIRQPWEYICDLFSGFDSHILTIVTNIIENKELDRNFICYVQSNNKAFLKRLKWMQKTNNIILDKYTINDIKGGIRDKLHNRKSDNLKSFDEWVRRIKVSEEFDLDYAKRQYLPPSIKKQLNLVQEILADKVNRKRPCFIYLQPEELHFHNNWFSYDIVDKSNSDAEYMDLKAAYKSGVFKERGYLTQTLALIYVDNCLRKFFYQLRHEGLLDNTIILITADHGSSYGHAPIRNGLSFNNFFSENYHIPLFIYNQGEKKRVNNFLLNCDVIPTLMDIMGKRSMAHHMKGHSAFSSKREIIHSEYMGPGYQDLWNKKIWFSARNSKYKINYIVGLFDRFESGRLEAVYNIIEDPKELNNLVKSRYDEAEVGRLLQYLYKRRCQIQEEQERYWGNCVR